MINKRFVAIAGNVGVGKSTLTDLLSLYTERTGALFASSHDFLGLTGQRNRRILWIDGTTRKDEFRGHEGGIGAAHPHQDRGAIRPPPHQHHRGRIAQRRRIAARFGIGGLVHC